MAQHDCHASRQTNVPSNQLLLRKPKFFKLEGCGVTPSIPSVLPRRQAQSLLLQCSFAAVIRVITQHSSPLRRVTVRDGPNAQENCNILQASATKETGEGKFPFFPYSLLKLSPSSFPARSLALVSPWQVGLLTHRKGARSRLTLLLIKVVLQQTIMAPGDLRLNLGDIEIIAFA